MRFKLEKCTGRDCILIDDMEKNISEWNAMGGTGILNVSAEETMRMLKEMGVV